MCKQLSISFHQYWRGVVFIQICGFVTFSSELFLVQYFKVLGGLEGEVLELTSTILKLTIFFPFRTKI